MYAELNSNDELVGGKPVKIWYRSGTFQYTIDGVTYTAPHNWFAEWDMAQKNAAHMWVMIYMYDDGVNPPSSTYDKSKFTLTQNYSYTFDGTTVTQTTEIIQTSSGDLPPVDGEASKPAYDIVVQGQRTWNQDRDRRAVGATPVIPDADQIAYDMWMKDCFDAQDAGTIPPDPPASVRRSIDMPEQEEGQCVIQWHEFTGSWPGWGFKAIFKRNDITALGLKVYDENDAYLYALTFVEGDYSGEWVTETPAGFATPTKVARSFEIIAGSAPVTEFLTLDDTKEYISFIVKWVTGTAP